MLEKEKEKKGSIKPFQIVSSNFQRSVFKINYVLTSHFNENQSVPLYTLWYHKQ